MEDADRGVEIRHAEDVDLDALTQLGIGIQQLHADGRPDLFNEPVADDIREFFRSQLAEGSHVLVAETGASGPIGYLIAEHRTRDANPFMQASSVLYIHHISVEPSSQATGIGQRLMDAVVSLARTLNVSTLRLDSWHFNTDAHGFFESQGFTPVNIVFERQLI
ncbi:GNAT family N-acetyltransferase [Leifsonia sp. Root112D2]|uniref:GNAT family N-acetyltransferase n=1 Tax=Leifsonia sp. Root112D2 TaxID=1736426 RepID=UPI000A80E4AC|nr:GNAT family N-acetyltransferase [Leifsonia sp. Root112D2]